MEAESGELYETGEIVWYFYCCDRKQRKRSHFFGKMKNGGSWNVKDYSII